MRRAGQMPPAAESTGVGSAPWLLESEGGIYACPPSSFLQTFGQRQGELSSSPFQVLPWAFN